jgi:hypothetical protein
LDGKVGELDSGSTGVVYFVRKLHHEVREVSEYGLGGEKPIGWIERYILFGIQNEYFC